MEHFVEEPYIGGYIGVSLGEWEFECEESSFPDGILCSFDGGDPEEQVFFDRGNEEDVFLTYFMIVSE